MSPHARLMSILIGSIVMAFLFVKMIFFVQYRMPLSHYQNQYGARQVMVPSFQLFPPNAAISLTEDNSTFFPARPAAFGAELPEGGLSAALWIGAGFGEDGIEPQGELGCSDVPGWKTKFYADGIPVFPPKGTMDDGTDNYLEDHFLGTAFRNMHRGGTTRWRKTAAAFGPATTSLASSKDASRVAIPHNVPHHSDIESLQEGAEIAGKIVLLRRGGCGFLAKVLWAQRRGAVAVIVGDDRKGGPLLQMYAAGDTSFVTIPSVFTAHTTAHILTSLVSAAAQGKTSSSSKAAVKQAMPAKTSDQFAPAATADDATAGDRDLFVTIAPSRGSITLLDLLFVVFASPLAAIVIVTSVMACVRAHYRRRAWRAPRAVVDQLPVHVYYPPGTGPRQTTVIPVGSTVATPMPSPAPTRSPSPATFEPPFGPSLTTPLLSRPRSRTTPLVSGDEPRPMMTYAPPPPHRPRYFQSECIVCLEDYVMGDHVMSLPCGHEFHAACITPWLTTRRRTCPICKGDVVMAVAAGEFP